MNKKINLLQKGTTLCALMLLCAFGANAQAKLPTQQPVKGERVNLPSSGNISEEAVYQNGEYRVLTTSSVQKNLTSLPKRAAKAEKRKVSSSKQTSN